MSRDLIEEARRRLAADDLRAPGGHVGTVGDLTQWGLVCNLTNALSASEARNRSLEEAKSRLATELRMWRLLVNEGGVPRYTVIPGAALNSVVTSTDALLRRQTPQAHHE